MNIKKRIFALLIAVCMIAGMLPVSAFAAGCEHHISHTAECGYAAAVEGAPCTHECGAECYTTVTNCTHSHDENCGWAAATEDSEEVPCGHVCDTACETQVLDCSHKHDENCGYVAAVEGVACKVVCDTCSGTNPASEGGEDDNAPTCTGDENCVFTGTHNEGCPYCVVPCTHSYGPWDWFVDEDDENNNTFLRACGLCQEEERNYMPEAVVQIMSATPEAALATKAALEQAVADGVLTQDAAKMLLDTLSIMPTVENPVAKIGDEGYETLAAAISAAGDGDTITLMDGTHTMPATVANKNITIKGSKNAVVEMLSTVTASSSTIHFDGITAEFGNTTYNGLIHSTKITYTNCTLNGQQTLYAQDVDFTKCTLVSTGDNYSIWTWGAEKVAFTGCVFNSEGKAVLVYGGGPTDVNLTDCSFNSTQMRNKAAVEIGDDYGATYTVTINNCFADSGFVPNKSTSNLWGNKNDMDIEHLTVNLDGVEVTAVAILTVDGTTTKYSSLEDAINAVNPGQTATIKLADGTHTMPTSVVNKNITITGSQDAVIEALSAVGATGSNLTFKGVTLKYDNDNYEGFQHANKIAFEDCKLIGTMFLYAPEVSFNRCTFEVYDAKTEYSVWTYGSDNVAFHNCIFNTHGKAVLVYNEGEQHDTVTVTGCTFNSDRTIATDKAAIEVGSSPYSSDTTYYITIDDCTANGFVPNNSTSPLWGNKNSMDHAHLNLVQDGTNVTAPFVDMSRIILNNKVYDGKMLTYTGKAVVSTYRGELKDATGDSYDFTYEWYEKKSDGTYQKITGNTAPKEIGEYKLVMTPTKAVPGVSNLKGEILVKIEKAPAPNTNTNTQTVYVYSEKKLLQTGAEVLTVGLMAFAGIFTLAAGMWLLRKKSYGR